MATGTTSRTIRRLGLVGISLHLAASCFGQTNPTIATVNLPAEQVAREFAQRSWQRTHGLPDDQVKSLLQTRNGFLWIGTGRGLARFDGLKFVVFDHLNTPELTEDNCNSLAEDSEGNVWISTNDGLVRCRDGKFTRFTRRDGLPVTHGVPKDIVGAVCADRHGGVWCLPRWSVVRFQDGRFTKHLDAKGVPSDIMLTLHRDRADVLWVGGGSGQLYRLDQQTGKFETAAGANLPSAAVVGIQDDANGGLWLLCVNPTRTAGIIYHFHNGNLEPASNAISLDPRSLFLVHGAAGDLWLATGQGAVVRFREGRITRFPLPREFGQDFVLCALEDREGNLWLGTEAGGLHCWKPKSISSLATRDGLANDSVWTIGETRNGSVWIGTDDGLSHWKDGGFRTITKNQGLAGDKIRSVAEDATGDVWVGTGSGLSVIRGGVAVRFEFPHTLEKDKTRVVLPATDGTLWLGTVEGLFRYHEGVWVTYRATNGLANDDVRALCESPAGSLWIGTAGGGMQKFRDGEFTTFTTTNGLSNNSVWAFRAETNGVLWVGTESGLNRLAGDKFTVFSVREGLPANLVNEILEDDFGNLWVSHDYGIYRVRKQELDDVAAGRATQVQAVSYSEADGLPSNETNGQKSYPAGCKTRDGQLWFPTPKGVAIIDPKLCARDAIGPQAAIEQVRVDGEVILDRSGVSAERRNFAGLRNGGALPSRHYADAQQAIPAPILLPPGSGRVLEFRFTAPVFTAPEKASFRYRLRGVDDRWIEAGTRREAYFTRLRPGDYSFEVLAANHRGVWGEQAGSFSFAIQPFFYQTWWFYAACSFGGAGAIAFMVLGRIRSLRVRHLHEQQAAIVEERTRLAKDLHDGLGADLTRLTMLADLADDESGTAGAEHARKLSQSSRAAARELKEMIWVANPTHDALDDLISRIASTVEEFLHDARIKCRLQIPIDLPAYKLSVEQRRNLLLVAREAINNVIKHSGATEVSLHVAHGEGTLTIEIVDNGRGFDSQAARGDGLGLGSMRKRMESLGGTFLAISRPGIGTTLKLSLPLPEPP